MIGRVDHQAELPFALFLISVDADVHRTGAALFAHHRGGVDIGAGIPFVVGEHGKKIEIDVIAFEDHFFARRVFGGDFLCRNRMVLAVSQVFYHLWHRRRAQ